MNSICGCAPGNDITIWYSIILHTRIVSSRTSQTQYGISWNPEYHATNNCTNSHMSLSHQPLPVDEKRNANQKRKKKKDTVGN